MRRIEGVCDRLVILHSNFDTITLPAFIEQWSKTGKGLLAHKYVIILRFGRLSTMYSGADAGIKMRPDLEDLKDLGPEFKSRWQEFFVPAPDKPLLALGMLAGFR